MSTRQEEREWLVTSKAWQAERDAVGIERVVDSFDLTDATVTVNRIDLRRWAHTNPELAERLHELRSLLGAVNQEMMKWIQDQADAAKVER